VEHRVRCDGEGSVMAKKTAAATLMGMAASLVRVVSAAGDTGPPTDPGSQLTGTWIVTVEPPAPRPKFTSLQAYTRDGRVFEDGAPFGRTTAYGSWEHVMGQVYAATTEFLRVNPDNQIEKEHINRRIVLLAGGEKFTFNAEVTRFDQTGAPIQPPVKVTGSGERMKITRIPD
jgi:hypothetical protein